MQRTWAFARPRCGGASLAARSATATCCRPPPVRPAAVVILAATMAFIAAFAFAAVTSIGLIVPIVRAARVLIGARYAARAAHDLGPIEHALVTFLHSHPARLAEVFAMEITAHA